jgi:hypothetical protein
MSSREACWSSSSTQEHHDDREAASATPHGSIWPDPIAYISIGGSKYCFLQENHKPKKTLRQAQNEFGLRIKKIRSDNGTEFKNSQIEGFLEEEGIKHEFSSPYTPQQNSVVERKKITILDMATTMLDGYKTSD